MTNTPKNRDEVVELLSEAMRRHWHGLLAPKGTEPLLTALEAAGLRIVPAEATEEMNEAFWGSEGSPSDDPWEIMLDASPYNPQRSET